MTKDEAREVLGYKKNDDLLKTGLNEFKKSYKKLLKKSDIPDNIRAIIKRDLEAVEVLINED